MMSLGALRVQELACPPEYMSCALKERKCFFFSFSLRQSFIWRARVSSFLLNWELFLQREEKKLPWHRKRCFYFWESCWERDIQGVAIIIRVKSPSTHQDRDNIVGMLNEVMSEKMPSAWRHARVYICLQPQVREFSAAAMLLHAIACCHIHEPVSGFLLSVFTED